MPLPPHLPLRRLLADRRPHPGRIFFLSHWFRGHNNIRYEELIPRLRAVDAYLLVIREQQPFRALQFGAMRRLRPRLEPWLTGLGGRRYHGLFTTENEQIPHFPGPVVSDVDDPRFTEREAAQLGMPHVQAYVVTEERAARRLEQLGVEKPWYVVPQGVTLAATRPEDVAAVAAAHRRPGDFVVGYVAAWLLQTGDRGGGNPLYNVEHLFELWAELRERVPRARLWLLGGASASVEARARTDERIVLFGRVPRERLHALLANFDVGLYPRAQDQGIQSIKIAEYMGAGVPTVSYDYAVAQVVRRAGAGVLVPDARAFVEAVAALAADEPRRAALGAAARAYAAGIDWDVLAARYEEILARHLLP